MAQKIVSSSQDDAHDANVTAEVVDIPSISGPKCKHKRTVDQFDFLRDCFDTKVNLWKSPGENKAWPS